MNLQSRCIDKVESEAKFLFDRYGTVVSDPSDACHLVFAALLTAIQTLSLPEIAKTLGVE